MRRRRPRCRPLSLAQVRWEPGGGLFGVSATDVGIIELDFSAIGIDFCGGIIGSQDVY
jgi:hypothetical protein